MFCRILLLTLLLSSCTTIIQPIQLNMDCMIITGQGIEPEYGPVIWTKISCSPDDEEPDE